MPLQTQRFYSFEEFRVDAEKRLLLHGGQRIPLAPKVLDTLLVLLENHGRVIEKDELMKFVWPDTVVEENNLNQAISALRRALGEDPTQHRYIVTVPGHGYRFVAPINAGDGSLRIDSNTSGEDRPTAGSEASPRSEWRRAVVPVLAASLFIIVIVATYRVIRDYGSAKSNNPPAIRSLAVLPLENLAHDPAEDYFADGMTDELITQLGQIAALRVISRTSVMRYRGSHKSLPQIARELNVDVVVEGTVLRSGDRVRITAQLIRTASDQHLWARSYEGNAQASLTLQESVARDIAGEIRAQLTPQERAKLSDARPVNPAAYDAYLRGRYFADRRTAEDLTRAISYFQEAIRQDPNWAPAYARLADVEGMLSEYKPVPPRETHAQARVAIRRALELDDALAEAHVEMANMATVDDYDWVGAEREFHRALELDPGDANAHYFHGSNLMCMARFDEAMAEMERARALDPLSTMINTNIGMVYRYARRPDEAIEAASKALELSPDSPVVHEQLGLSYLQKGMYSEAIKSLQKAISLSHGFPWYKAELAYAYAATGDRAQARQISSELERQSKQEYVSYYSRAIASLAVGDRTAAISRLESAYQEREDEVSLLKVEPLFDSLRSDPRFQEIIRRVGL